MARKKKEIERRWFLRRIKRRLLPHTFDEVEQIQQGYLDVRAGNEVPRQSVRVRITRNGTLGASEAVKNGRGLVRDEVDKDIPLELGRALMPLCRHRLAKTRRESAGWELDTFHGPLKGLVFLEREFRRRNSRYTLPPWVGEAVEVTNLISNRDLAKLATKLKRTGCSARVAVEGIIARKLQSQSP